MVLISCRTKKKRRAKLPNATVGKLGENSISTASPPTSSDHPSGSDVKHDESEDGGKPADGTKRDKRRAKEARKKAELDVQRLAAKETRKSAKKNLTSGDSLSQQNSKLHKRDCQGTKAKKPSKKGDGTLQVEEFTDEKVAIAVDNIREKREKMAEKWGDHWSGN